jgi:hypothetical protein
MIKRVQIDTNPLAHLYGKQKVGQEGADECALIMLIALDAAKRGRATAHLSNSLALYLLAAVALWHKTNRTGLYREAVTAFEMLAKACRRPTELLDLTTGEYTAIRGALAQFIRVLPLLELNLFTTVLTTAQRTIDLDRARAA